MILNFKDLNQQEYPDSLCELDKCKIKNVKLFKYLGSNIDYRDASTGDNEINQRLDSAEAKFYEHSKKLLNYKVHLRTRVVILNALVRSRLTRRTDAKLGRYQQNKNERSTAFTAGCCDD